MLPRWTASQTNSAIVHFGASTTLPAFSASMAASHLPLELFQLGNHLRQGNGFRGHLTSNLNVFLLLAGLDRSPLLHRVHRLAPGQCRFRIPPPRGHLSRRSSAPSDKRNRSSSWRRNRQQLEPNAPGANHHNAPATLTAFGPPPPRPSHARPKARIIASARSMNSRVTVAITGGRRAAVFG